jgi:lambda family phage portal protein|tara:strand:+ start:689 stop:2296 length:1608 start_codon:yes stop_codon:yes gene_type:complete
MKWNPFKKKQKKVNPPTHKRYYESSVDNRLTADWLSSSNTANEEIYGGSLKTKNRARELERNNPLVFGALNTLETQIIGKGQRLRAEPRNPDGKVDQDAKKIIEAAWKDFCLPQNCEVTGRYSFQDLERMTLRSRKRDGEFIVRIDINSRYKYGFKLQILETDVLDLELNRTSPNNGNRIRMGVELDSLDRAVAYWVFSSNPNSVQMRNNTRHKHERIPANKILHGFKATRIGQVRGITEWASAMQSIKGLQAYQEAEIAAARVAACNSFQLMPPPGTEFTGDLPDQNNVPMFSAEPASLWNAANGKIETIKVEHPTTQQKEMRNSMLREISTAFGLAFDSFSNDITEANFSNARLGKLAERDGFMIDQSLQRSQFNDPVFEIFLNKSITKGILAPLRPAKFVKYSSRTWIPRSYAFVDPKKDLDALILQRDKGWISDEYAIEIGPEEDINSVYGAIQANAMLAEKHDLEFGSKQKEESFQEVGDNEEVPAPEPEETETEEEPEEERGFQEGLIYPINGINFVYKDGNLQSVNDS